MNLEISISVLLVRATATLRESHWLKPPQGDRAKPLIHCGGFAAAGVFCSVIGWAATHSVAGS
jgi:hypothetical protein